MILKHIPNALTLFRLGLIIPFLMYLFQHQYVSALYIFILAGLTDGLDGWLARHFHWQSFLGFFLDPLADKLLVAASFISLALIGLLPWWLVILVFFKDINISIGVFVLYRFIQPKLDFEPTLLGKFNTAVQLLLVTLCLFELAYFKVPPALTDFLIYVTAFTTVSTYIQYGWLWFQKAWPKQELIK